MRVLLWFRNDLRLQDHALLHRASVQQAEVVPVYCFDPRQFGQTDFGFPKTGGYRAQFLRESVTDLQISLQSRGSDLIIRHGKPEAEIPRIAQTLKVDAVYWHQEMTAQEVAVEAALTHELGQLGIDWHTVWGATLYHPEDLPFELGQLPEIFTQFRKLVENQGTIRSPLLLPARLPALPVDIDLGTVPTLSQLGLTPAVVDQRAALGFRGGESAAWQRLQHYFWQSDSLQTYKETRNGLLGANYSSKFSPWLALGCLSPRQVWAEVQAYEAERVCNESTYWLVFELLWRDYFRFVCAKHGNQVFYPSGLQKLRVVWQQDWPRFERWAQGKTGFPLVDANMQELAATGYMSNRGRQNVASFLTKNLGIDWRMGAEWFESLLIDYDVCSNWGNWNYAAGVGNDARGFRYFNILKQSRDYDPEGLYVKQWLPELKKVPPEKIHTPWQLTSDLQKRYGVRLGVEYPWPMVDLEQSAQANEKIYNRVRNQR